MAIPTGTRLISYNGKCYKIIEKVGAGGIATVYKASIEEPEHDKLSIMAVKVMHEHISHKPQFMEHFIAEASILSTVKSEHIVKFFDTGEYGDEKLKFLVMEFVQGETLDKLIEQRSQPFSAFETLQLMRQVSKGLQDAINTGEIIAHRDIKPENLKIAPGNIVKILDFGIAKSAEKTALTLSGVVGTPTYMSPEQIKDEEINSKTDIYSLGCIAFEMLTGRKPYEGKNVPQIAMKHVTSPIPTIEREDVAPDIKQLVRTCMAKNPEDRPTPAQLIDHIDKIIASEESEIVSIPDLSPDPPKTTLNTGHEQESQARLNVEAGQQGNAPGSKSAIPYLLPEVPPSPTIAQRIRNLPRWIMVVAPLLVLLMLGSGFILLRRPPTTLSATATLTPTSIKLAVPPASDAPIPPSPSDTPTPMPPSPTTTFSPSSTPTPLSPTDTPSPVSPTPTDIITPTYGASSPPLSCSVILKTPNYLHFVTAEEVKLEWSSTYGLGSNDYYVLEFFTMDGQFLDGTTLQKSYSIKPANWPAWPNRDKEWMKVTENNNYQWSVGVQLGSGDTAKRLCQSEKRVFLWPLK